MLTIEPVNIGHSGVYTCHATSRGGEDRTQTVELIVQSSMYACHVVCVCACVCVCVCVCM